MSGLTDSGGAPIEYGNEPPPDCSYCGEFPASTVIGKSNAEVCATCASKMEECAECGEGWVVADGDTVYCSGCQYARDEAERRWREGESAAAEDAHEARLEMQFGMPIEPWGGDDL